MGIFKIKADDFEWIGGAKDDPQDLCLHGHVTVRFEQKAFYENARFGDKLLRDEISNVSFDDIL